MRLNKSLVLLSGGLDSTTTLAIARHESDVKLALSIVYGQRHERELRSAEAIARYYGLTWSVVYIDGIANLIGDATALIGTNEDLPKNRDEKEMAGSIPRSYVPGRNTIMLAIAQSVAEANDLDLIYTGFNAVDYSGYPDCRPEFVGAWNALAKLSTKRGIEGNAIQVVAPIILKSKEEIVTIGVRSNAPLELTWSCYQGGTLACRECDSCKIRLTAFEKAGFIDLCPYVAVTNA